MCGRLTLTTAPEVIAAVFGVDGVPALQPRYNIAPTQSLLVVRKLAGSESRGIAELRWGLIPYWAKDPAIGNRTINARAETVATTPAFREAFRRRRCLVIADGFYEWQRIDGGKQPYLLRAPGRAPFALAGLWEVWRNPAGERLETCTIITTAANRTMEPLHDRMPVVLPPDAYERWLDPELAAGDRLAELLVPCADELLAPLRVGSYVSDPRHEDARCVEPLRDPE